MKPSLVAAGVALLASTACTIQMDAQAHIEREEKRFEVAGVPELHLTTFDGSIQIRSWDRPEVLVEVEKRGSDKDAVAQIQVTAEQNGNVIRLETRQPASARRTVVGIGVYHSPSAKLLVSVPRQSTIIARSDDGSITVDRVDGRLDLRTEDGSVKVTEATGEVVIATDDGSVTLDRVNGPIDARSGDGSIRMVGKPTRLALETRDGSIVVRAEEGSAMEDDWSVRTGDGSVTFELPRGFAAYIDAETDDGRVRSELTLGNEQSDRDRERLQGQLNDGGRRLRIRSGDGSIRLRES